MEKNKSVVEETLLQIRAVEEAISENAKGILASTMKEEISQLVKESLKWGNKLHEQDVEAPEEGEVDPEMDAEVEMDAEFDGEEEGEEEPEVTEPEMGFDDEGDNQEELPPLDMTQASPDEVLRVFKAMGDQDGIIVKKQDDGDIHLMDNNNNTEYLITFGGDDSQEEMNMMERYMYEDTENVEGMGHLGELGGRYDEDLENEDYGIENEGMGHYSEEYNEEYGIENEGMGHYSEEYNEEYGIENEGMGHYSEEYNEEYGIENEGMGHYSEQYDDDDDDDGGDVTFEMYEEDLESVLESFKYSKTPNMDKVSYKMKEGTKHPKLGNAKNAAKYPKSLKRGVTETETDEMGSEFLDEKEIDEMMREKGETTEASRTQTYKRRAQRGRVTAPSQVRKESINKEMNLLIEKNEEYKKALDFFRKKLDEVAVFNSNLAYATRLFTEHSTTKQEKINILRRFDNLETIKESKNLYKIIKDEISQGKTSESINESVQRTVVKTPQNGSSTNLIESKTYENPQFLRMKDLMTKIK
jgi:hypothetical protein